MGDLGVAGEERDCALAERRSKLSEDDRQAVRTFIADYWTLEYDLARSGLAEEVYIAACLANNEEPLNENRKIRDDVIQEARAKFAELSSEHPEVEERCVWIYRMFTSRSASKAVAAQYLADLLNANSIGRERLPAYLVDAIEYVTVARE